MTLNQLEIFIHIAEKGGIRKAAMSLNKTQPSLSTAIKNLEIELKVKLFSRDGYRLVLTDSGAILYHKALAMINFAEEFKELASELATGRERQVHLAIDYSCPVKSILSILKKFQSISKTTTLKVDFEVLDGAEEMLLNREVILAVPPFISQHSELEFKKLHNVGMVAVALNNTFAALSSSCSEVTNKPQIVVKNTLKINPDKIKSDDYKPNQWIVSDHMIKKELILAGIGWGYLEKKDIAEEIKQKKLQILDIENENKKTLPLYLVKLKKRPLGPVAKKLWDSIELENM